MRSEYTLNQLSEIADIIEKYLILAEGVDDDTVFGELLNSLIIWKEAQ